MRFMILLKADKNTEAGVLPDETLLTDMGNEPQAGRTVARGRGASAGSHSEDRAGPEWEGLDYGRTVRRNKRMRGRLLPY